MYMCTPFGISIGICNQDLRVICTWKGIALVSETIKSVNWLIACARACHSAPHNVCLFVLFRFWFCKSICMCEHFPNEPTQKWSRWRRKNSIHTWIWLLVHWNEPKKAHSQREKKTYHEYNGAIVHRFMLIMQLAFKWRHTIASFDRKIQSFLIKNQPFGLFATSNSDSSINSMRFVTYAISSYTNYMNMSWNEATNMKVFFSKSGKKANQVAM